MDHTTKRCSTINFIFQELSFILVRQLANGENSLKIILLVTIIATQYIIQIELCKSLPSLTSQPWESNGSSQRLPSFVYHCPLIHREHHEEFVQRTFLAPSIFKEAHGKSSGNNRSAFKATQGKCVTLPRGCISRDCAEVISIPEEGNLQWRRPHRKIPYAGIL